MKMMVGNLNTIVSESGQYMDNIIGELPRIYWVGQIDD